MYDKPQLGLAQVQAAMSAMLERGSQESHPVTSAIVDDQGGLIAYARMDNCPLLPQKLAFRKAYTSISMGVDSGAFAEALKGAGIGAGDLGDPNVVPIQGGVAIRRPSDGALMGGIGVSGLPSGEADEAICRIGLKALNL